MVERKAKTSRSSPAFEQSGDDSALLNELVLSMPGVLFRISFSKKDGLKFCFVTPGCEKLLGVTKAEIDSLPSPFSFVHQDDIEHLHSAIEAAAATLSRLDHVFRVTQKDGTTIFVEAQATPKRLRGGTTIFDGVFLDLTESKEQEQIALLAERARQAEDFVSTLAHDMKVPLVGADRVLELLLSGTLGTLAPEQLPIIAKLRSSNQKLLAMLRDLLDVYRYESGAQPMRFQAVNLGAMLKSCVAEFSQIACDKEIEIETEQEATPIYIVADADGIKLLVSNLMENAVKFTPPLGKITVSASYDDMNSALLKVENTGTEIPEAEQAKLFQRFWQGESGKRYVAGTGLGLYLCRRIANIHKGSINCKSGADGVTAFTVRLPAGINKVKANSRAAKSDRA